MTNDTSKHELPAPKPGYRWVQSVIWQEVQVGSEQTHKDNADTLDRMAAKMTAASNARGDSSDDEAYTVTLSAKAFETMATMARAAAAALEADDWGTDACVELHRKRYELALSARAHRQAEGDAKCPPST